MRTRLFARTLALSSAFALALLGGCAAAARSDAGSTAATLRLYPGERIAVAGHGRLHYLGVRNDSRCRPEVQCIHAGDAEVLFELETDGGAAQSFALSRARPAWPSDEPWLRLLDLGFDAAPVATLQVGDDAPADSAEE